MHLVMVGNEKIDLLEELAIANFKDVENRDV
jgi:hypothetical protein